MGAIVFNKKIALVHDFLRSFGGAERVLLELHHLFPEAPIYSLLADPKTIEQYFPNASIQTSYLQHSWLRHRQQFLLPFLPQAIESFDFSEYDVVISSSGAFAHGIITSPDTTHICYCHSPMRYAWDWHAEYLAEKGIRKASALASASSVMNYIRTWDYVASKRVDYWIANSQTVSNRIEKFYRAQSQIIYPPVDTTFFKPTNSASQKTAPYAVTVSRLSKYKRIDLLLAACKQEGLPLVVIGEGEDRPRLEKLAASAQVTFTGRISDTELRGYLEDAYCFLTAVEEDFGIAPVEALSLGIPVVGLGIGGVAESVVDGQNGILFEKPDLQHVATALRRLGSTHFSSSEIQASAEQFSKERFRMAIQKLVDHA